MTLSALFITLNGLNQRASSISPVALKIASFLPKASTAAGSTCLSSIRQQYYRASLPARHHQVNDKQSIFFRYIATKQNCAAVADAG